VRNVGCGAGLDQANRAIHPADTGATCASDQRCAIVACAVSVTAGRCQVYAGRVEPLSLSEITQRVSELRLEHRHLDAEIDRLGADIQADELSIKRLKKRKLWLRDCISRFESALIPDQPA